MQIPPPVSEWRGGGGGERIRVITGVKKAGNLVIICKKTESDSALMPF